MTKIITAIVLAILVIGGGVYLYQHRSNKNANQNSNNQKVINEPQKKVETPEPGQNKITAAAGKLVKGFPPELILENNVTYTESFSEDYSNATHQFTAKYDSTKTPQELFKLYNDYFTSHGYTLSNQLNTEKVAALYATKAGASVNFTVSKIDPKQPTKVVITYLVAPK